MNNIQIFTPKEIERIKNDLNKAEILKTRMLLKRIYIDCFNHQHTTNTKQFPRRGDTFNKLKEYLIELNLLS